MRIVSGRFRGRALSSPKGMNTRPTSDAARKALFDILENGLGLSFVHVADFFAGTGALGLEALSRGGETLLAFEKDRNAQVSLEKNLKLVEFPKSHWHLVSEERIENWGRVLEKLEAKSPNLFPIDTVFCDPPYAKELVQNCFKALSPLLKNPKIFHKDLTICVEVGAKEINPKLEGFEIIKERIHGAAKLLLYQREA